MTPNEIAAPALATPPAQQALSTSIGTTEVLSVDLNGVSVLVVEDSWALAQIQKVILEGAGVVVIGPAATIVDAEAFMATRVPDVAVLDINLQGEMSYGLIESLTELGIPVIVVTAYEVLPDLEKKVAAILRKPFQANALLQSLRRVVDGLNAS